MGRPKLALSLPKGGGVIGDVGVEIVALATGCVGAYRVAAEEAAQGWIEITRPQMEQTGGRGVLFAGVT